ncbi:hypothetical protein JAAARDRAFT_193834 [Jaapia argillacea MUCL 33604]|uniref:DRBM domain-containing protein n=1 Tax=Jaapia argillacea MUCL 33604 TaxID=933084 RepID=A0A067PRS0_9AGAM|nr:hypothetical protein JAAARDRAFT_193834 [Jaapia argillacea MUCL 33604]
MTFLLTAGAVMGGLNTGIPKLSLSWTLVFGPPEPSADAEEVVEEVVEKVVEPAALFRRICLFPTELSTHLLYTLLTLRGESHLLQAEYLRTSRISRWICIMYFKEIEYSRGVGQTKVDAREEAARICVEAMAYRRLGSEPIIPPSNQNCFVI